MTIADGALCYLDKRMTITENDHDFAPTFLETPMTSLLPELTGDVRNKMQLARV